LAKNPNFDHPPLI